MTSQQGWRHHEWDVVAQCRCPYPAACEIDEVDFCSLCGQFRLHMADGSEKISKKRPEIPTGDWL